MSNNSITSSADNLIYLVSCAVNGEKPDRTICEGMNDGEVFDLARRHLLTAAAAGALSQAITLPQHWKEARGKAMRRQAVFTLERNKLLHVMEENGIWYLPLKGIILQQLYPKTAIREMADNDILFDASKAALMKTLMEDMGYTCEHITKTDNGHDVYTKAPFVCFELHHTLVNRYPSPRLFDYYAAKTDLRKKDEDNQYGYHMTNEDFYIFLIGHMYKHYIKGGTGLRSLLDVYVFCRRYAESMDRTYIETEMTKMGICDFERSTRSLAEKVFTRQPLSDEEQQELVYFIESGSFGTQKHLVALRLDGDDSKQAKLRYVMKRLFPLRIMLQYKHPFACRHKILYPLLLVYRPFEALAVNRKKVKDELRYLKEYRNKPE